MIACFLKVSVLNIIAKSECFESMKVQGHIQKALPALTRLNLWVCGLDFLTIFFKKHHSTLSELILKLKTIQPQSNSVDLLCMSNIIMLPLNLLDFIVPRRINMWVGHGEEYPSQGQNN